MNGFYVPGSVSGSYVANKRDEEGTLLYEGAANEIGIQKQAAIQQLEKNYAATVENAYASYLAANRGVQGSQMGQGYKELYKQIQQQQLQQNIASTTSEFNKQVMNVEAQEESAKQQIQERFQQEVSYFDRLQQSLGNYFEYVKTLTDADGNGYFDPYELNQSVDSMYDILGTAQPIGQYDAEGNYTGYSDQDGKAGMTYSEWIANQMGTSDEDQAWYQWMISGGFNEFMNAPKSTRQWQPGELKAIREEETALKNDLQKYIDTGEASDRVNKYLQDNTEAATEIKDKRFDKIYSEFKGSKDYGVDTDLGNYILTNLPSFDKYNDAEKSWLKVNSGKQWGGKANLAIKIRESMLDDETKKWLKDNGFVNTIKTTPNTLGGRYNQLVTYFTDAMSKEDVKKLYRKLYDSSPRSGGTS